MGLQNVFNNHNGWSGHIGDNLSKLGCKLHFPFRMHHTKTQTVSQPKLFQCSFFTEMFEISPYAQFSMGFQTFGHVDNQDRPAYVKAKQGVFSTGKYLSINSILSLHI